MENTRLTCQKLGCNKPAKIRPMNEFINRVMYTFCKEHSLEYLDMACDIQLEKALSVIDQVLQRGYKDHPTDSWKGLGVIGNLDHAREHMSSWGVDGEDNLAHAACRLLMALQLREEAKLNDDPT